MAIAIDPVAQEYLYQQVTAMVQEMHQTGALRTGDKLPSLRAMSKKLGVSIATVQQAYSELERMELVEARPKSGFFLKPDYSQPLSPRRTSLTSKPQKVRCQTLIERVQDAIHQPNIIPLGIANPASANSAEKSLARYLRRAINQTQEKAISYGPVNGYKPLQRQIALRYLDQGLQVDPDEVIITHGAQEALAIALQCVAKAGDVIAVESPSYFGILELIENLGMMALEIPLCPDDGVWLEDLEKAIDQQSIKACLFSSAVSNPMGSYMPNQRRQQLVAMLEKHNIPLIEDDVYGDLCFSDEQTALAQRFSKNNQVLSCSSFSKTVAAGYRIGWLLAGEYTPQAKRFKRALSYSSSLLYQKTLAEFLASGDYDRNLLRLRRVLLSQRDRMIPLVMNAFPEGVRVNTPQGGGVLWIELPKSVDSAQVFQAALDANISIAPGSLFSPSNKFKHCIRLSYGIKWDDRIEPAIKQLGTIIKAMV